MLMLLSFLKDITFVIFFAALKKDLRDLDEFMQKYLLVTTGKCG